MSKNGMPTFQQRSSGYVNLTRLPTPKSEYIVNFPELTGGLNLYDPDYRLKANESPDMLNMLWKNGTLCSRAGQAYTTPAPLGNGWCAYDDLYWGNAFLHINSSIYYAEPSDNMQLVSLCDLSEMYSGYIPARGTFLRYGDDLFYKAPGVFVRIHYNGSGFECSDVAAEAYTPITYINADWRSGAGTAYQPENRLSANKTIWYNAAHKSETETLSGNGETKSFTLTKPFVYLTGVTVNGATVGNWTVSGQTLIFYAAPAAGENNISVTGEVPEKTYRIPVTGATIVAVTVDGQTLAESEYSHDPGTGIVTLVTAAPVTQPLSSNTVRITYSKANPDALASIMDCPYAIVYGGDQNICMVVGGCKAQPNAFFWNGNNVAMDVSYWPMEQYNLGGDTEEAVTGFGKQQGMLVVFKTRSIGKGTMQFTTLGDNAEVPRKVIEIDYTAINSRTGCDLPWSIQLIENNLCFCNTEQGVHIVLDSSAAHENNVVGISRKINGDNGRYGLLSRIRSADTVSSFDDNWRYWIIADGDVFCWDYTLSEYRNPSWFYLENIRAASLIRTAAKNYYLNYDGRVVVFDASYSDFGESYERRYQFATQFFGSYDRLKSVTRAIFSLRSDTDLDASITYKSDWESRDDLTDIQHVNWRLVPRNLRFRNLKANRFAITAIRAPRCIHVRHFAMILTCTSVGCDMPILSAQLFYKYEGRDR